MIKNEVNDMSLEDALQYAFSKDVSIRLYITKDNCSKEDDGRFECETILYTSAWKDAQEIRNRHMSFGCIRLPELNHLKQAIIESVDSVTSEVNNYNNKIEAYYD